MPCHAPALRPTLTFRQRAGLLMAVYVFFGQQGYRGMVRPHALRPIEAEVGDYGLLAVADHYGEVLSVRPGFGVPRNSHRGLVGQVYGGPIAEDHIERDAAFGGGPQGRG